MTVGQWVDAMLAGAVIIALVSIAAGVWHWAATWWRGGTDEAWDEDSWL